MDRIRKIVRKSQENSYENPQIIQMSFAMRNFSCPVYVYPLLIKPLQLFANTKAIFSCYSTLVTKEQNEGKKHWFFQN